MLPSETYTNERLDYLGIVAGVYQEIGLASYLDVHAGNRLQQMSIGTATVGMILNGLGWSLRRVYLVPQFFTNKAVEHLLGQGMTAEKLNDDCLRHTLDWLYENKPTTFFACIAPQVCKMIGIQARHVFLKDQLLLASSLFLKKPEQIVALDLIMVLCLLVFRLAEHRLRVWLTETGDHSQPDQLANRDSYHSALVFPCFEGIELLRAHAALTHSLNRLTPAATLCAGLGFPGSALSTYLQHPTLRLRNVGYIIRTIVSQRQHTEQAKKESERHLCISVESLLKSW